MNLDQLKTTMYYHGRKRISVYNIQRIFRHENNTENLLGQNIKINVDYDFYAVHMVKEKTCFGAV